MLIMSKVIFAAVFCKIERCDKQLSSCATFPTGHKVSAGGVVAISSHAAVLVKFAAKCPLEW